MKHVLIAALVVLLACCNSKSPSINKFSDPIRVKIADLQDRRLTDSLYVFFNHENPLYRMDALYAFASIQDSLSVDKIGKLLLMDADTAVRKAAAFAMGQLQNRHCERILLGALVKEKNASVIFEILESYGKTTSRWRLDHPTQLKDSTKSAGLAWSLYRAGLRKKTDTLANRIATTLLDPQNSELTRLGAAHFFARGASNSENAEDELILAARHDPSAHVRMAAASALSKVPTDSSLATLKSIIKFEEDPRVIANAVRSLGAFPFDQIKYYLYEAVDHKDVNVGIASSEILIETIAVEDWIDVSALTNRITNFRIQANLYQAALKAGKNKDLAEDIKNAYQKSNNPYQKAALLHAFSDYPDAYEFVRREINDSLEVIRSTAAATLVSMNRQAHFPQRLKRPFSEMFKDLLQSDDHAVLGTVALALADAALGHKSVLKDPAFLYDAKKKLRLPRDMEALQPIEAAIAHFESREPALMTNEFNHPINWELVKTIPDGQLVTIKTTKGNIKIALHVNEAPGSVANFVSLARENYFDDKFVHRVVPNFVIQAGCNRGDGWGSEQYSIRSEFSPRRYETGSVGMASAGKDTEGTQWFITHSSTPHLDGRYSLFAEVKEGMAVVNFLQVGDKIIDVVLETSPAQ